jgi:hypothetical protein
MWENSFLKSFVGVPTPSGFEAKSNDLNFASSYCRAYFQEGKKEESYNQKAYPTMPPQWTCQEKPQPNTNQPRHVRRGAKWAKPPQGRTAEWAKTLVIPSPSPP